MYLEQETIAACLRGWPVNEDDLLRLDRQVCFPLYAASNLLTRLYWPLLDAIGLTYPQYLVMMVLWEHPTRSVGEIAQELHLDTGTLTPLLKRMEAAGLVSRKRDPEDERRVLISLTDTGDALRVEARRVPEVLAAKLAVSPTDLDVLRGALSGFIDALSAADPRTSK